MKEQSETGKKHRLRIIFDGVIAVGPPHPDSGDEDGPLFGVMAHSTRRQTERSKRNPKEKAMFIPMHVPTIFTKLKPHSDGDREGRRPDEVFQLLPDHPIWYLWHPIRERMQFKFDGDGEPGRLTYQRDPVENYEDRGGEVSGKFEFFIDHLGPGGFEDPLKLRSIRDVPDAREIWPDRSRLLPGLLEPKLDPTVDHLVAAQIFVPRGHVGGGGSGKKGDGMKVEFVPPKPRSRREAKTVVPNVVVTVEAEYVEIAMQSLDTQEPLDPLLFHLTNDADIWISNGDPSDVAINVKRLARRLTQEERGSAEENFGRLLAEVGKEKIDLVFNLFNIHGGGLLAPEELIRKDLNRVSEFDIDFELFYMLMDGRDDKEGLPLPRRADGKTFDDGNCYCKLACRPEAHR